MSVELYRESPGKFDSRTLSRTTLNRWTGRTKDERACNIFRVLYLPCHKPHWEAHRRRVRAGL